MPESGDHGGGARSPEESGLTDGMSPPLDRLYEMRQVSLGPVMQGYVLHATPEDWDRFVGKRNTAALHRAGSAYSSGLAVPKKRGDHSVCWVPMLDPTSSFSFYWSHFLVGFDLVYTAFLVPISAGFALTGQSSVVGWLNILSGPIYLSSLVFGFHTGFIVERQLRRVLVLDGRASAQFYMQHGTFYVDVISVSVYALQIASFVLAIATTDEVGAASNALQLLRMLRLMYVVSLTQRVLNTVSAGGGLMRWLSSTGVYTLVVVYMLAFLINATACVWFLMGWWYSRSNRVNWIDAWAGAGLPGCHQLVFTWNPPLDLPPECAETPAVSFGWMYMTSLYWAMTTVGYGDISPTNTGEIIVGIIVMLGGIMTFVTIIGLMQDLLAATNSQSAADMNAKMIQFEDWARKQDLSEATRSQIRRYYREVWGAEGSDSVNFFAELPRQLQTVTARDAAGKLLESVALFNGLGADALAQLASKMTPLGVAIGSDLCVPGERADRMWILKEGVMLAVHEDGAQLVMNDPPDSFGVAMIVQDLHPAFETAVLGFRASTSCTVWELSHRDLMSVVSIFPEAGEHLRRQAAAQLLERSDQMFRSRSVEELAACREQLERFVKQTQTQPPASSGGAVSAADGASPQAFGPRGDESYGRLCSMVETVLEKISSLESRLAAIEGSGAWERADGHGLRVPAS